MKQSPTIEKALFDLPDCTPGALDYLAQAHTSEMYATAHLFRQISPLFGLPVTYALNSFYLKRYPYGKTGRKQHSLGQHLLDELLALFKDGLAQTGWTYKGVSANNGKTEIWQPPAYPSTCQADI